jgi:hypothetical protein
VTSPSLDIAICANNSADQLAVTLDHLGRVPAMQSLLRCGEGTYNT